MQNCYNKFGALNFTKLVEDGLLEVSYDGYGDSRAFAPITIEKHQDQDGSKVGHGNVIDDRFY